VLQFVHRRSDCISPPQRLICEDWKHHREQCGDRNPDDERYSDLRNSSNDGEAPHHCEIPMPG
jgi:hypothetical protein